MAEYLLVIASSARMLAQAALGANFKPLVIDLFADADTCLCATAIHKIASLAPNDLAVAVDALIADYPLSDVVYGSGFENHPESLCYLADKLTVWGNTPDVFAKVQDKPYFFAMLDSLAIPYPDVRYNAPEDNMRWLLKPRQGQGGQGVKPYVNNGDKVGPSSYWQRYQPGQPHSVLFFADGARAVVVGFNRQWTVSLGEGRGFTFAGIINQTGLSGQQQTAVAAWLDRLVPEFGLVGINSLDFILDNGQIWVLEINPRISASMQLYGAGLLQLHMCASNGHLSGCPQTTGLCSGYQIIYANADIRIPEGFFWPQGCVDLPATGVICRKGEPICSIMAHHKQASAVLKQLGQLQHSIFKQLQTGFDSYGTPS